MKVDMTHTGIPLTTCINIFTPFIVKWVQDYFNRELNNVKDISIIRNGVEERVPLAKDVMNDFTYDIIKEKIHLFTKAPGERFEVIKFKLDNGKYASMKYLGRNREFNDLQKTDSSIANRYMTWTDIFYQAAVDVCKDKHVYITRYPLEDYFGIYPSRISVLSTFKTQPQYIENTYYDSYPVIDLSLSKEEISGLFVDSMQPFNSYLSGLGGENLYNKIS